MTRQFQCGHDGFVGHLPTFTVLQTMRREFEYWYPFDLRVSGKDLIQVRTPPLKICSAAWELLHTCNTVGMIRRQLTATTVIALRRIT